MSADNPPTTARPGVNRASAATRSPAKVKESVLKVLTFDEIVNYEPPKGTLMVGDGIIELGATTLLYGLPGSFKGFAVGQLMAYGAQGHGRWLGFDVQCQFASLWINCENGRRRLQKQHKRMKVPPEVKKHIFATDIPSVWSLTDSRLVAELRETIIEKNIGLVIIDTLSNFAADEMAKDFAAFFAALNSALDGLPKKVAVLLIHHARKPKESDRGGRGLLNCISGHQTVQRRSRCILYIGRVTEELDEKRIVSVCLKCSDNGEAEGHRAAMLLNDECVLTEIADFNWSEWEAGRAGSAKDRERPVTIEHLRVVFQNGKAFMSQNQAAEKLEEMDVIKRSAACNHLKAYREEGVLIYSGNSKGLTLADEHCTPGDDDD